MKTNSLSIQDIMIGDWVMISDFPLKPMAMQIRPRHFVSSCLRFEPIPLTKDLLEKNGFNIYGLEEIPENIIAEFDKVEITIRFGEFYITINTGEYRITQIHYLHELQHFFKLCGIEKEWVL